LQLPSLTEEALVAETPVRRGIRQTTDKEEVMGWINRIKETLTSPSMRGYRARWQVVPFGEQWDGGWWEGMKDLDKYVREVGKGRIALFKYQHLHLYQGGNVMEDVSDSFDFEIIDNKVILKAEGK